MTVPTTAELAKLRTHPHNSKLFLSIYQPTVVLAAQVNDLTADKGLRLVTYDNVTSGNYLLINSGMTMYVGTTTGSFDCGVVRVRSATDTVITVAENAHVNWANNYYITVVNFYEINAIYPRIIQDPADETKTLWYKDYDIDYAGQNSALGSFVCMGCHYAGFTGDVFYSASGTVNLKNEALSYSWFFEGGNPTGSFAHTPGNIAYATPGHYTTRLIVSGTSSGAVDTSYRHISIYDRPEAGTSVPILNWEMQDLSGSRDQAGYVANIRILQTIPETTLKDGSLAIIFADDWYGDTATKQSIGGNSLNRSTIVFVGYVIKGSIQYNYRDSYVDFSIGSPTEIMRLAEGFSVSVQDSRDPETATSDPDIPSSWITILDMDIKRAIYHYLKWHSTVLYCADVIFKGTDRALQYFDADRTSIYDAVNSLLQGAWLGSMLCDRQGNVFAEREMCYEPTSFATNFTLSDQDWLGDIDIDTTVNPETSFIELGGIAYSGSTGTYTALLSNAPGLTPAYRGRVLRLQGVAPINQTEMDYLCGTMYNQRNVKYPNIDIEAAGNYRNFDITPQEKIPLTVSANDTIRGISFTAKNFFINRMQWKYDPKKETFNPNISLTELGAVGLGLTNVIPDIPPPAGDGGGIVVPPIIIPPWPPWTPGSTNPTFAHPISVLCDDGFTLVPVWDSGFAELYIGMITGANITFVETAGTVTATPLLYNGLGAAGIAHFDLGFATTPINGGRNVHMHPDVTFTFPMWNVLYKATSLARVEAVTANTTLELYIKYLDITDIGAIWVYGWTLEWS